MSDGKTNVFSMSLPALEAWRAGEPVSANKLNQVVEAENARRGVAMPRQVVRKPLGGGGEAEPLTIVLARFKYPYSRGIGSSPAGTTYWLPGDWINVQGIEDGDKFYNVIRPNKLQRSPWDNVLVGYPLNVRYEYIDDTSRWAIYQGERERQEIIPRLTTRDHFLIMRLPDDTILFSAHRDAEGNLDREPQTEKWIALSGFEGRAWTEARD